MSNSDEQFADHREVWELIPWVVNGTAGEADRALVLRHTAACADCARELQSQMELAAAIAGAAGPAADADAALRTLSCRIDGPSAPSAIPRRRSRFGIRAQRTMLALVFVEAAAIAVLGAALWDRNVPGAAVYRTLSSGARAPRAATIRAVIDPALPIGELQRMLRPLRLQIVGGPSASGVLSLAPTAADAASDTPGAIAALRTHPAVRFAEPTKPEDSANIEAPAAGDAAPR